jgi:hypothetical protein
MSTMVWNTYVSSLITYKVWPHNQYGILVHFSELLRVKFCGLLLGKNSELLILFRQNTMHIQIGWPPCAPVCFITIKGGMPWLLVEMGILSSPTCTGELSDAEQWGNALDCLLNAIKALRSCDPSMSWWDVFAPASICRRSSLQGRMIIGACDCFNLNAFLEKIHNDHIDNQDQVCTDHNFQLNFLQAHTN